MSRQPHAARAGRGLIGPVAASLVGLSVTHAEAADLAVEVVLPDVATAAYHRPYVAMWIERQEGAVPVGPLAVLYDLRVPRGNGVIWLRNLRTWWRNGGDVQALSLDGVSGPTRAPGRHAFNFSGRQGILARLPDGNYNLVIEAAREQGGRELVRTPFQWRRAPVRLATTRARGSAEIGAVTVTVTR